MGNVKKFIMNYDELRYAKKSSSARRKGDRELKSEREIMSGIDREI